MGRVLVTRRLPDGGLDPLAGHELVGPNPDDTPYTPEELRRFARECDAIVSLLTDRIDADVLAAGAHGGRLRVVANVAVGYDNIDVTAATAHGVTVCNTPGVLDETTADTAFLLILAACRLASTAEAELRSGRWTGWGVTQYLGRDVHGATLGVVGFGRIGRAVARRAAGFGMRVLHHARRETNEPGYVADLDELLAESDIVSLHTPGGPDTYHLIDARRLALMKPTAVLVNTARGTGRRRARTGRSAARRTPLRGRPRRLRTRARDRAATAQRAAHRAAAAHRLGIAGDPHPDGDDGDERRRDGARGRFTAQRRDALKCDVEVVTSW